MPDIQDRNPYNASVFTIMGDTGELTDAAVEWQLNDYIAYSGGVDFLAWEQNRVNGPLATASGFYPLFEEATITSRDSFIHQDF